MGHTRNPLLATLDGDQGRAVTCDDRRVLVIAGAGAGKTLVLTRRVAYLVRRGINPAAMLLLTFTRRAAAEMRERIEAMLGWEDAASVTVGTCHSVGLGILRSHGYHLGYRPAKTGQSIVVYDDDDRCDMLDVCRKECLAKVPQRECERFFSRWAATGEEVFESRDMERLWNQYQRRMKEANAIDFAMILAYTRRIFAERPDVLAEYRLRWPYVFVDEFQDTDPLQYRLHMDLNPEYLFVVGDPRQLIYGWRGSSPEILRNFVAHE